MLREGQDILRSALESLGLTSNEIATYETSLSLGCRPASIIAKVSGLNRGHTYEVLTSLKTKGFVEEVMKNSVKQFVPVPPQTIVSKLGSLASQLQSTRERLEVSLPQLILGKVSTSSLPLIQVFQGGNGLEKAWDELIAEPPSRLLCFIDSSQSMLVGPKKNLRWRKKFQRACLERGVEIQGILSESCEEPIADATNGAISFRVVGTSAFEGDVIISESKLGTISQLPQQKGLLLEDETLARAFRAVHSLLWDGGVSVKNQESKA